MNLKEKENRTALRPLPTGRSPRADRAAPTHNTPVRVGVLGLVLGFLLLAGCVAGPTSNDAAIPVAPGGNLFLAGGNYTPLIYMIIVGCATLSLTIAVLYMVANLLRQPEWEALLKTELYQILVSIFWGVFLISAAYLIDGVTSNMAGGQSLFDVSQGYLAHVICISEGATIKMEGMKVVLQYMAGMKSQYYASVWGPQLPTYAGFDVLERAIDLIQTLVTPFTSSLFVQSLGLDVIHGTALLFLLPVGILMRIAPPTREAGSFLIAAAFGLYFILPFTYLIDAQVMNKIYTDDYGYAMCSGSVSQTNFALGSAAFYDSTAIKMLPGIKEDIIATPISVASFGLVKTNGGFVNSLSYIAVQAVFLPALGMVLVVSFIRSATKFFSQKMD